MDNYAHVPDNKDKEAYQGVGDLSDDEEEDEDKEEKPTRNKCLSKKFTKLYIKNGFHCQR